MLRLPQGNHRRERRHAIGVRETRAVRAPIRAEARTIMGYSARFNVPAEIGGPTGWIEVIQQGAFARAIRERQNVAMLVNHSDSLLLGRTSNNSLRLREDSIGLAFECDCARTGYADDLLELVRRGDISECSFGFVAGDGEDWSTTTDENGRRRDLRILTDIQTLYDCSAVTYPAFSGTSVTAAGREDECECDPDDPDCECDPADLDSIDALVRMGSLPRAALELRSRRSRRSVERVRVPAISDEEFRARALARIAVIRLESI